MNFPWVFGRGVPSLPPSIVADEKRSLPFEPGSRSQPLRPRQKITFTICLHHSKIFHCIPHPHRTQVLKLPPSNPAPPIPFLPPGSSAGPLRQQANLILASPDPDIHAPLFAYLPIRLSESSLFSWASSRASKTPGLSGHWLKMIFLATGGGSSPTALIVNYFIFSINTGMSLLFLLSAVNFNGWSLLFFWTEEYPNYIFAFIIWRKFSGSRGSGF